MKVLATCAIANQSNPHCRLLTGDRSSFSPVELSGPKGRCTASVDHTLARGILFVALAGLGQSIRAADFGDGDIPPVATGAGAGSRVRLDHDHRRPVAAPRGD